MLTGLVIKFIGTIMDLMIPWMLSYILDYIVPQKDVRKILLWGVLMLVAAFVAWSGNITANRMASMTARETTRAVRGDLFAKISALSCRQIDEVSIPSLEARLTTDTYNINQTIGMMQRLGVRAPILLIGGICVTLVLEPILALVMIAVLPFIILVVYTVSHKGVPMYTDFQRSVDRMVQFVRENISGIRIIKALSRTEQEKEKFENVNQEMSRQETKAAITMGITNPMMNLFLNLGMTPVIIAGAYRVNAGVTKPGTLIAFLTYFTIILNAMLSITRMFVMYSRATASAQRINEILCMPEELSLTTEEAVSEEEYVVFEQVSFSYKGKKDTLCNISFRLKKEKHLELSGQPVPEKQR